MSENMINTGFFGSGSNVPLGVQAVAATTLSGGNLEIKKKDTPTAGGGMKRKIYAQSSKYVNNYPKSVIITLNDLGADTKMQIEGAMESVGLSEISGMIKNNATDEAVCEKLTEKLVEYLESQDKFDSNKLSEVKKNNISDMMDKFAEACKQANLEPHIVSKIIEIKDKFRDGSLTAAAETSVSEEEKKTIMA